MKNKWVAMACGFVVGVCLTWSRVSRVDMRWNQRLPRGIKCACGKPATLRCAVGQLDWKLRRHAVFCQACGWRVVTAMREAAPVPHAVNQLK